ncbi:hypothetical protein [Polaromonas aquatica]|uniref:hypothetical protein n=1 Tax=Polaromonas aquatica TaxID=332657 RepID=UPI003D657676
MRPLSLFPSQPLCATLAAFTLGLLPLAGAHALTAAETPYVGMYTQSSSDARAQLMLLDDNTFCFSFMGGSLDMLAGGRWKAEGNGVRLQEVRQNGSVFPTFGKVVPEQKGTVEFDFHGHSLSRAVSVAFATGTDEALPTSLRRLFDDGHNGWSSSYKLPPMPVAQVRYFYIADAEVDANGQPKQLRVVQYRRGDANTLRVGYNRAFGSPPLNQLATLKDDEVLHVDGRRFGVRKELPEKALERIRSACIQPALAEAKRPSKEEAAEIAAGTATSVKPPPLVPVKTFYLPLTAIQGAPYFPADK